MAVFGYFGIGNLGNEGTLAAVLAHLRRSRPEDEVTCIAPGVEAVEHDHGVPTIQMTAYRPDGKPGGVLVTMGKAASRLWDLPRTFRMVGRFDTVVVAGTGSLEAKLKVPAWGLPYWLFLTALCCRLRRRRFALVGVGVERSGDPAVRFFYRWTLRLATFCSVRDEGSRRAVRALGARRAADRAEVSPDLAFTLTAPTDVPVRPSHAVVGVIQYAGPEPSSPGNGSGYIETMADLVTGLLLDGCTVRVVVGDHADVPVAEALVERVRGTVPDVHRGRVSSSAASTMAEVMAEVAAAELVVASRFHNVICALMLAKPTVCLGYARKHEELMADFGFGDLVHDLDRLDGRRLRAQVEDARRRGPELQMRAKDTMLRYEDELGRLLVRLSSEIEAGAPVR